MNYLNARDAGKNPGTGIASPPGGQRLSRRHAPHAQHGFALEFAQHGNMHQGMIPGTSTGRYLDEPNDTF